VLLDRSERSLEIFEAFPQPPHLLSRSPNRSDAVYRGLNETIHPL
jgi:hypothetical protein